MFGQCHTVDTISIFIDMQIYKLSHLLLFQGITPIISKQIYFIYFFALCHIQQGRVIL